VSAAKEILQDDTRATFCLCYSYLYLCLFLLLFYLLSSSDLGLLMSFRLGQCQGSENDEERVDRDCDSSEAC
jgi:hypothetical protein